VELQLLLTSKRGSTKSTAIAEKCISKIIDACVMVLSEPNMHKK
jgi:phage terminase large subunit